MKRSEKRGCITAILLLMVVAAFFCLHWAWKYYELSELPDRREYKTIEERAEKALAFAKRHNMNQHYVLFVDYGIPSGTPLYSAISQEVNALPWGVSLLLKNMATDLSGVLD